jgi:glutaryl-CoA dehydrogenase
MLDTQTQKPKKPIVIPKPNSDFYQTFQMLSETEQAKVLKVGEFMRTAVAPIINDFWARDEFPFDLVPGIRDLQIAGSGYEGYECAGGSNLLSCYIAMEIAKVDCSLATFYVVHSGLAMGSIYLCGSEEQKNKWLPPMARLEKIGSFGLTEPLVGSGASRGLLTTARREGDTWILNGQKKWIGNSTWGDVTIIWARDEADTVQKWFCPM